MSRLPSWIKKEKRRERFASQKLGGNQREANGGTDFLLEDNFLFSLKFKETKRTNCPSKQVTRV